MESGRTECSKSCGTGSQTITETRNCTNPPPSGPGARLCSGDSKRTSTADCNTQECPGKYHNYNIHSWPSMYHLYHSCTLTYGPVRTNLSQNVRIRTTAVTPVLVHGGWSQWAESGRTECSKTCGTGSQTITQTRNCTILPPSGTGAVIIGRWVEEVAIETDGDDDDVDDDNYLITQG